MDDQRLEIRISRELLEHVERARGELSRSAFVKAAVRRHVAMLSSPDVAKMTQVVAESMRPASGPPPQVVRPSAVQDAVLKCPVAACLFRARSAAARCPDHGRTVVPS